MMIYEHQKLIELTLMRETIDRENCSNVRVSNLARETKFYRCIKRQHFLDFGTIQSETMKSTILLLAVSLIFALVLVPIFNLWFLGILRCCIRRSICSPWWSPQKPLPQSSFEAWQRRLDSTDCHRTRGRRCGTLEKRGSLYRTHPSARLRPTRHQKAEIRTHSRRLSGSASG